MTTRQVGPVAWLVASAAMILLAGCGADQAKGCTDPTAVNYDPAAKVDDGSCLAFQGPRNPDFEGSTNWVQDSGNGYAGNGTATFTTGTGFMPTHGLSFLTLATGTTNNWYTGTTAVYQDGVSFQRSTSLTFDWAAKGYGDVTVDVLFTANGTATLWSKVLSSTFDVQKLAETVALPGLPDRGRLTIRVTATGGQNTGAVVQLDNLRVN